MSIAVKIVLIITIALVIMSGIFSLAWVYSPTEFVIKIQVSNSTLDVISNFTNAYENKSEDVKGFINKSLEKYSEVIGGDK